MPSIAASIPAVSTKPKDQQGIEAAVRWGDDPGRATATMSAGQTAKYLFQLSQTCDDQVKDKTGFTTIYRAGIMCSGHYGRLGFFHAMMSVDDAALIAAAPSDAAVNARAQLVTRDKILAWTDFTYRVATGAVSPDDKLCTTVSKDPVLAPVFDDGAKCRNADAAWTVRRFFTFKCTNPRLEKPCDTARRVGRRRRSLGGTRRAAPYDPGQLCAGACSSPRPAGARLSQEQAAAGHRV